MVQSLENMEIEEKIHDVYKMYTKGVISHEYYKSKVAIIE